MYVSQVVMSQLPNIEVVTILIIVTTSVFGVKALASIYIFVICEILTYGVSIWSINYLYVWAILCFAVLLTKKFSDRLLLTILAGIFGIAFGTLCSIPYFIIGGVSGGFAYIIQGFWFDIIHCIGNLTLTFLLYTPLKEILQKSTKKYLQ